MKDYIKSVIDVNLTENDNLNRVREYLQAYFLNVIYKKKFYQNLVFTGGTAFAFLSISSSGFLKILILACQPRPEAMIFML